MIIPYLGKAYDGRFTEHALTNIDKPPKGPTSNNKGITNNKMHEQGMVGQIWSKGDSFIQ